MNKYGRIITLSLVALFLFSLLGCGTISNDPLKVDSTGDIALYSGSSFTTTESGLVIPSDSNQNNEGQLTSDFYSISMEESYDRYGIFTFLAFSIDNWYDHEKYFAIRYVSEEGEPSMYAPMTLKYRDYPDGKTWSPVCKDPLCTHTGASGCPLAKCQNPFGFICMDGRVFFVGSDAVLYLYNSTDNSCTALHDRLYEYKLYEQDGAVYAVYQLEDEEFNVRFAALKATPDGTVTELGSVGELFAIKDSPVYADRYLLDASFEDASVLLLQRDLQSEEVKTVLELDYSETADLEPSVADVLAVYGDRALFRVMYRTEREHEDIWLVDLLSGEKRLLASKVGTVQNWLYSDRCVIWADARSDATEPFTVHLLFPKTGEEQEFELSALVAAEGGRLPLGTGLQELKKGALLLTCAYGAEAGKDEDGNTIYEMDLHDILEFDLQSGKLRLYPQPDLPEYETTFR